MTMSSLLRSDDGWDIVAEVIKERPFLVLILLGKNEESRGEEEIAAVAMLFIFYFLFFLCVCFELSCVFVFL